MILKCIKRCAIYLIIVLLCLISCTHPQKIGEPGDESLSNASADVMELPSDSKPDAPTYSPLKPSKEQITDPQFWKQHYLHLTIDGYQPNCKRGDLVGADTAHSYIINWLASTGQLSNYISTTGDITLPYEQYFYLVDKFFGEANVQAISEKWVIVTVLIGRIKL